MPKVTRDKWADKGVNTSVEQIVEGVNDSQSFYTPPLPCFSYFKIPEAFGNVILQAAELRPPEHLLI